MKKFVLLACAALMILGTSCSKGHSLDKNTKELCDSISLYSGSTVGTYVLSDYLNYIKMSDTEISKDDIMKGIQLAFANADSEGYIVGLQIGVQLLNQMNRYSEEGIDIDRNLMLKGFRKSFEADTVNMEGLAFDTGRMNALMDQVRAMVAEETAQQPQIIQQPVQQTEEEVVVVETPTAE